MGQFSWVYSDTGRAMLDNKTHDSFLLVPPKFQVKYGQNIHETCYDGYGHFDGWDVYELVAEWNRDTIPQIVNKVKQGLWKDSHINTEEMLNYYYGRNVDCELRDIGIWIACYDEDNAQLKYPIKIVENGLLNYDDALPSNSDENQGWGSYEEDVELDDITGTIGEWLDSDTSNLPDELVRVLQNAYNIAGSYL